MSWMDYTNTPANSVQTKNFNCTVKAADDSKDGTFTGYASVFGAVDLVGEVVMPGAFTETLIESGGSTKVLAQHDAFDVIGTAQLEQTDEALDAAGTLELGLPSAAQMYLRIRKQLIDGISIGFTVIDDKFEDGVRKLQRIKLWEISLVTFPAMPLARVTGVKGLLGQRLETLFKSDPTEGSIESARGLARAVINERKELDALLERLDGLELKQRDDEDEAELLSALKKLTEDVRQAHKG